jgi:DNA polymerase-1
LDSEFTQQIEQIEESIFGLIGHEVNLRSPKQLSQLLFEELKLPVVKKTKTGYSTDEEVLETLASLHEIPRQIQRHRLLSKLLSTYVQQLPAMCHPEDGRLHTSFNQTITATGRLSSSNPNLQNIPIRSIEGRRIREAFCAAPGYVLLSADYSQIELRLLAAFSEDKRLREAFEANADIHRWTAASIFGCDADVVTSDQRAQAKTVNFGILYGQSAFSLGKQLGVSQAEAQRWIQAFYDLYPGVGAYRQKILAMAYESGEVRTWYGRRRMVPELRSANKNLKSNAERIAFNTIFQGSAADLIKKAMIDVDRCLDAYGASLILQVHDELVVEAPESQVGVVKQLLCEKMQNAIPCPVELKVEVGVGSSWATAH